VLPLQAFGTCDAKLKLNIDEVVTMDDSRPNRETEDNQSSRALNELEAVAAINYLYAHLKLARMTIGGWAFFRRPPAKEDMLWLASEFMDAERAIQELVNGPETDGRSLDAATDALCRQIAEHQAAIDNRLANAS
jgi:hypothetical protein